MLEHPKIESGKKFWPVGSNATLPFGSLDSVCWLLLAPLAPLAPSVGSFDSVGFCWHHHQQNPRRRRANVGSHANPSRRRANGGSHANPSLAMESTPYPSHPNPSRLIVCLNLDVAVGVSFINKAMHKRPCCERTASPAHHC